MAPIHKPPATLQTAVREARGAAVTIVALGAALAILYYGRSFFITGLIAVVIAFILDPFVTVLMRMKLPRSVASFLVCAMALLGLYVIGLGAYSQFSGMYENLPQYGETIGDFVASVQHKIQGVEQGAYTMFLSGQRKRELEKAALAASKKKGKAAPAAPALPPVQPQPEGIPIGDYIYAGIGSFSRILLMASFVPFLVYFMLSWREHMNRSFLQLFQGEDRLVAARSLQGIGDLVRAFVVGNALLGLLLAILSGLAFWAIHLPYPAIIGTLSGFLSLVPYIGLPLAVIPPLFAALGVNQAAVYVLVVGITAILHLVGLNVLYPKIVGSRVHLNPLVVTFSLMLWGFLWGSAGLLLAIPLTAGIKAVCDNVKDFRPIGKFLGD